MSFVITFLIYIYFVSMVQMFNKVDEWNDFAEAILRKAQE